MIRIFRRKIEIVVKVALVYSLLVLLSCIILNEDTQSKDPVIITPSRSLSRNVAVTEKSQDQFDKIDLEIETLKQKMDTDLEEFWWAIRPLMDHRSLAALHDRYLSLVRSLKSLRMKENLWKKHERESLSKKVQAKIWQSQNHENCQSAKYISCNFNKSCGFGCQIHNAAYCLIVAFSMKRVLVLNSKHWRYNDKGFEDTFEPISETCTHLNDSMKRTAVPWPGKDSDLVIKLPFIDAINPQPKVLPQAIPNEYADKLLMLFKNPAAWWVGQFVRYILRPKNTFWTPSNIYTNLQHPYVGLHIRRTDKGTEAKFHDLKEYMQHVEEFFKLENPGDSGNGSVFVASDDPEVLLECKNLFPKFKFFGDPKISDSAQLKNRYSPNSLRGLLQDLHFLSQSDFLVCTFSSQICRLAYEILLASNNEDYSDKFRSLDDIWYFGGQTNVLQEAIIPHKASNSKEILLEIGDKILILGNHWNGFNFGKNLRTSLEGLYPGYKVKNVHKRVSFSSLKE